MQRWSVPQLAHGQVEAADEGHRFFSGGSHSRVPRDPRPPTEALPQSGIVSCRTVPPSPSSEPSPLRPSPLWTGLQIRDFPLFPPKISFESGILFVIYCYGIASNLLGGIGGEALRRRPRSGTGGRRALPSLTPGSRLRAGIPGLRHARARRRGEKTNRAASNGRPGELEFTQRRGARFPHPTASGFPARP